MYSTLKICHTLSRRVWAVLYYTILYYTILFNTILYCTILYFTILYCTILYYIIRHIYQVSEYPYCFRVRCWHGQSWNVTKYIYSCTVQCWGTCTLRISISCFYSCSTTPHQKILYFLCLFDSSSQQLFCRWRFYIQNKWSAHKIWWKYAAVSVVVEINSTSNSCNIKILIDS